MPFVALTTAYVYFDARIRHELVDERSRRAAGRDRAPRLIRMTRAGPPRSAARRPSRSSSSRRSPAGSRAGRERARVLRTRVEAARAVTRRSTWGSTRRAGLVDRRRAARRCARLPALRPPAPVRAPVRLRPRPVRGRGRQEPEHGRQEAGLHGLIASQVASTASGGGRWLVFVVMVPAVLYARRSSIARSRSCTRSSGTDPGAACASTPKGVGLLGAALLVTFGAAGIVGWIRRQDELGGLIALLVYVVLVGGAWLVVSMQLPHRDVAGRRSSRARCCRRRPAVRQRLQRLRHHPPGRGSREHIRCARDRGRVALLARARRPADGRLG